MVQRTTSPQPETKAQQPVSISTSVFKLQNGAYVVLRYAEGERPDLQKSIAIAESIKGAVMLNDQDTSCMMPDNGPRSLFKMILEPGEWSFIRNPESEKTGFAAYIICSLSNTCAQAREINFYQYGSPSDAAPVLILKVTGSDAIQSVKGTLRGQIQK